MDSCASELLREGLSGDTGNGGREEEQGRERSQAKVEIWPKPSLSLIPWR